MEFPLLSTTSVIGNEMGGLSGHVLWHETTQERDSKRKFRYAILRNKVTRGGAETACGGFCSAHMPTHGRSTPCAYVHADCKVRHALIRLIGSVLSASLRSRCKMVIGAGLSVSAGVRRSRNKRFHGSWGYERHHCKGAIGGSILCAVSMQHRLLCIPKGALKSNVVVYQFYLCKSSIAFR
jgi:hypothetical protein